MAGAKASRSLGDARGRWRVLRGMRAAPPGDWRPRETKTHTTFLAADGGAATLHVRISLSPASHCLHKNKVPAFTFITEKCLRLLFFCISLCLVTRDRCTAGGGRHLPPSEASSPARGQDHPPGRIDSFLSRINISAHENARSVCIPTIRRRRRPRYSSTHSEPRCRPMPARIQLRPGGLVPPYNNQPASNAFS